MAVSVHTTRTGSRYVPMSLPVPVLNPDLYFRSGRVTMTMTTLLTLTAMFGAVRSNVPKLSYVTLLDVWMFVCIVFVFLVIIHFVMVISLHRYDPVGVSNPNNYLSGPFSGMERRDPQTSWKKSASSLFPFCLLDSTASTGLCS